MYGGSHMRGHTASPEPNNTAAADSQAAAPGVKAGRAAEVPSQEDAQLPGQGPAAGSAAQQAMEDLEGLEPSPAHRQTDNHAGDADAGPTAAIDDVLSANISKFEEAVPGGDSASTSTIETSEADMTAEQAGDHSGAAPSPSDTPLAAADDASEEANAPTAGSEDASADSEAGDGQREEHPAAADAGAIASQAVAGRSAHEPDSTTDSAASEATKEASKADMTAEQAGDHSGAAPSPSDTPLAAADDASEEADAPTAGSEDASADSEAGDWQREEHPAAADAGAIASHAVAGRSAHEPDSTTDSAASEATKAEIPGEAGEEAASEPAGNAEVSLDTPTGSSPAVSGDQEEEGVVQKGAQQLSTPAAETGVEEGMKSVAAVSGEEDAGKAAYTAGGIKWPQGEPSGPRGGTEKAQASGAVGPSGMGPAAGKESYSGSTRTAAGDANVTDADLSPEVEVEPDEALPTQQPGGAGKEVIDAAGAADGDVDISEELSPGHALEHGEDSAPKAHVKDEL